MKSRLFIAVNLPNSALEEIDRLTDKLKQSNSSRLIKYVDPYGVHLTLHFLGDCDENQQQTIEQIIADQTHGGQPTTLRLGQINGFPNLHQPRILYLGLAEEGTTLQRLQVNLGRQLEKAGFEVEHRPWRLHLTLARIRDRGSYQFNLQNITVPSLAFKAEAIDLMVSTPTLSGPMYKILKSFPLG